jgi:hypothetical protein
VPVLEGTWLAVLSLLPARAFVCGGGREVSVGGVDWVGLFAIANVYVPVYGRGGGGHANVFVFARVRAFSECWWVYIRARVRVCERGGGGRWCIGVI